MDYRGDCYRVTEQLSVDDLQVEGWEITERGADGLFRWCDFFVMRADLDRFVDQVEQRGGRVLGDFEGAGR